MRQEANWWFISLRAVQNYLWGPSRVNIVIREPGSRLQECQPKLALDFGVCLITLCCVKIKMQTKASKLSDENFFSFLTNFLNYLFLRPALMPTRREGIQEERPKVFIIPISSDPRTAYAPSKYFVNNHWITIFFSVSFFMICFDRANLSLLCALVNTFPMNLVQHKLSWDYWCRPESSTGE